MQHLSKLLCLSRSYIELWFKNARKQTESVKKLKEKDDKVNEKDASVEKKDVSDAMKSSAPRDIEDEQVEVKEKDDKLKQNEETLCSKASAIVETNATSDNVSKDATETRENIKEIVKDVGELDGADKEDHGSLEAVNDSGNSEKTNDVNKFGCEQEEAVETSEAQVNEMKESESPGEGSPEPSEVNKENISETMPHDDSLSSSADVADNNKTENECDRNEDKHTDLNNSNDLRKKKEVDEEKDTSKDKSEIEAEDADRNTNADEKDKGDEDTSVNANNDEEGGDKDSNPDEENEKDENEDANNEKEDDDDEDWHLSDEGEEDEEIQNIIQKILNQKDGKSEENIKEKDSVSDAQPGKNSSKKHKRKSSDMHAKDIPVKRQKSDSVSSQSEPDSCSTIEPSEDNAKPWDGLHIGTDDAPSVARTESIHSWIVLEGPDGVQQKVNIVLEREPSSQQGPGNGEDGSGMQEPGVSKASVDLSKQNTGVSEGMELPSTSQPMKTGLSMLKGTCFNFSCILGATSKVAVKFLSLVN